MKEIELTQGYTAIVDDEDYERVSQYNWHTSRGGGAERDPSAGEAIGSLGRFILGVQTDKLVGHINGDAFDFRKSNLRLANPSQLQANSKKHSGTVSKYKGVDWDKHKEKWRARVRKNGRQYHLGRFDNEIDAAHAYDAAALEMHGEFARINFPYRQSPALEHSTATAT